MLRGIAVDDGGNVYVTDASFNNFQVFDPNGRLLLAVGRARQRVLSDLIAHVECQQRTVHDLPREMI